MVASGDAGAESGGGCACADAAAATRAVDWRAAAREGIRRGGGAGPGGTVAVSAHPLPGRRSWLSALVAQASEFVFETVEEPGEPELIELVVHPVVAVVSAAPRSGASTVARLLAAELAVRGGGAAVVSS